MPFIPSKTHARVALVCTCLLIFWDGSASGRRRAEPELLRPGTRSFFAGAHLGSAFNVDDSPQQFKLGQEVGWHWRGAGVGPAVSLIIQEAFGNDTTTIQFAPRLSYAMDILEDVGVTVVPHVHFGLAHAIVSFPRGRSNSRTGINWQLGLDLRVLFDDRYYLLVRPFSIDVFHFEQATGVRYDMAIGAGVTFM